MDIDIKTETNTFKLRACGVIVKDNKILTLKSNAFEGYVFMGGHISLGENSYDAVIREMKEELDVDVTVDKLLCVNENVYKSVNGKTANEIVFYYLVTPKQDIPTKDFDHQELDNGKLKTHQFRWLDLNLSDQYLIYPKVVVTSLKENKENYYCLTDTTK